MLSVDSHVEVAVSLCYSFLAHNALMPEMTNLVKKENGEKKRLIENDREKGSKKGKVVEKEKDRGDGNDVNKKRKSDADDANEEKEEDHEEKKR